ncbi:hypothetical protein AGMMS50212_03860 [Spirochaetia bacterium]|nr:hypothetical protein AGMMS50212_03860 [Spirochaetia bacterium]
MMFVFLSCQTRPAIIDDTLNGDLPEASKNEEENAIYEFIEIPDNLSELPISSFDEVWAYLISGNETSLKSNMPITDLVYFNATLDWYGHLTDLPKRRTISKFPGRVHLAVLSESGGQTHIMLDPDGNYRQRLITELVDAAAAYDGLNIDFEKVPLRDADNFISFLTELRSKLGNKILSVCVPARTRTGGAYNYKKIASIADRVFVMAYDEHWSTSAPGPVASMNWCKTVASFSLQSIGSEKLVMGLPFYGRAWADRSTSRGLIHSTTEKIKQESGIEQIRRVNGIPTFKYEVMVTVSVYYEDEYSLATRMEMYNHQGVQSVGFWRLGQEPLGVWNLIKIRPR